MRLSLAARYFDRTTIKDGYTGAVLGKGQLDLYGEVTNDSPSIHRRVLEMNADKVTLPARGVVEVVSDRWVVGAYEHEDSFNDEVIRRKFVVHRAHGLAKRQTPEAVLANVNQATAYAGLAYFEADTRVEFGADNFPVYHTYFSITEPVLIGEVLTFDDLALRVNHTYLSEAGFLTAVCDQLTNSSVAIELSEQGDYDPIEDLFESTPAYYDALVMVAWQAYEHPNPSSERVTPGDLIVFVRKTQLAEVPVGAKVTIDDVTYRVLNVSEELGCWKFRIRP